jgi:2'-5' RNA ligase
MIDPQSDKTTGYHIFFEPAEPLKGELDGIVAKLAEEYGTPAFSPHVTVVRIPEGTEEEVRAKTEALAGKLTPMTLTLGEIGMEEVYFRALYIRLRELVEVSNIHREANEAFGLDDTLAYLPHLSLLYGNFPRPRKEATLAQLSYPKGATFVADRLHLYKTEGVTADWHKVAEFPLGPSSRIHE